MSLQADRLRNLRAVAIELPAGLSVLVGRNGEGKSTFLKILAGLAKADSGRIQRRSIRGRRAVVPRDGRDTASAPVVIALVELVGSPSELAAE